jgi:hypothetical protein
MASGSPLTQSSHFHESALFFIGCLCLVSELTFPLVFVSELGFSSVFMFSLEFPEEQEINNGIKRIKLANRIIIN